MPVLLASNLNCPNADTNTSSEAPVLTSSTLILPVPLLILSTLYLFGPSILRWRFPCQTAADLLRLLKNLRKLIEENSCLEQYLISLNQSEAFKSALRRLRKQASKIRLRPEPPRTNPFLWIMFRWRVLNDVDRCYQDFQKLELEIQATIHAAQDAESDEDT